MPAPPPFDDEPTRLIQTAGQARPGLDDEIDGETFHEDRGPSRLGQALGCLTRLALLVLIAVGALLAAALLLTPVRGTVLILGSDARPDELRRGEVGRTDTLLLLLADRATPRVAMVSIPRDLWVPIPGYGEERVNAAYELAGAQTAKQTLANALGVPVQRYAVIGLQGVRDVVDALGGVEITVERDIHDPTYPTDDYRPMEIFIPAGRQRMDGETALRYARTRYQDSDFGRIARQQRVLGAIRNAVLNPLNWPRLPGVLAAAQRSIKTDLTPLDLVAIGAAVVRDPGEPDRLVLDGEFVEPYTGQGGAALLLPRPGLQRGVAQFLGGPSAPFATVEVLNGGGVVGLARTTADRLEAARSLGTFEIARIGDSERPQARTTLLARPEARRAAEAAASALGLPGDRVSESSSLPAGIDVRLTVGADLAR